MAQVQARLKMYKKLTVHYRGPRSEEYEQRFADVLVTFHLDGWVNVSRDTLDLADYPPGSIIKLAGL
jgi:hypothetical protein